MTTRALKAHPKVYWIWNHRRWCLENVPEGPGTSEEGDPLGWRKSYWDKEMFVVEKMLDMDPRNCACTSIALLHHLIMHSPRMGLSALCSCWDARFKAGVR